MLSFPVVLSDEEAKMLIDSHGKTIADGCNSSPTVEGMPLDAMGAAADRIAVLCKAFASASSPAQS